MGLSQTFVSPLAMRVVAAGGGAPAYAGFIRQHHERLQSAAGLAAPAHLHSNSENSNCRRSYASGRDDTTANEKYPDCASATAADSNNPTSLSILAGLGFCRVACWRDSPCQPGPILIPSTLETFRKTAAADTFSHNCR